MMPEAWWEDLAKGTEMAFTKQKIANDFFLKELKAEEPSTYDFIEEGKKHDLKKRGFVDVAWGKQMSLHQNRQVQHAVVEAISALISRSKQ